MATINIVSSGDLTIHLSYEDKETKSAATTDFIVSLPALRLASPVWNVMLDPNGRFLESIQPQPGEPYKVSFSEDDPEALLTLLDIAHLNFHNLPADRDVSEVFQLAALCDKYDCIRLLRPWIGKWYTPFDEDRNKYDQSKRLFVAWAFGYDEEYKRLSLNLYEHTSGPWQGSYYDEDHKKLDGVLPPCALGRPIMF